MDLGELGDTPSVSSSKYCSTTLNFKDSTSVVLKGAVSFYRVLVRDNDDWNNHWSVHSTPEVVTMKVVYEVLFMDKSLRETAANQLVNKGALIFLQKVFSARLPILNRGINLSIDQFDVYYLMISPLRLSSMILVGWEYPEGREFSDLYNEDDL